MAYIAIFIGSFLIGHGMIVQSAADRAWGLLDIAAGAILLGVGASRAYREAQEA